LENSSVTSQFTIDVAGPEVNLESPGDDYWSPSNSIEFNYTPIDSNIDSCELWGNWSGWHLNDSMIAINGSINTFNKNINDGSYEWNIRCNDSSGNFAFNSSNYTLNIDSINPEIFYNPSTYANETITSNTWIFINITASDDNKESVLLQWQVANESFDFNNGDTYWENKTGLSAGMYTFRAGINDSAGNYNYTSLRTVYIDLQAPNYSNQNQTINGIYSSIFHRGEIINLSAIWSDDYNLSSAWLSTNESGIWENKTVYNSPQSLTGSGDISAFNWSNNSVSPGTSVSWRIYSNDSVGNENITGELSFTIWGWSEVGHSYLDPSGIKEGDGTTMKCLVRDNVTLDSIADYNVSFYNETDFMGSNLSQSDGYAQWSFNVSEAGTYTITCNITDDGSIYYNDSVNNEGSSILGVGYGLSVYDYTNTTFNRVYEGNNVNDTTIFTPIDDPYSDLTGDNNVYQEFRADPGDYAFTRYEFRIDESVNEIFEINITWMGYGDVGGTGTEGFILYLYNDSSGTWVQEHVYTTDNTEQTRYIYHNTNLQDYINGSGYIKVLARSYSPAPTGGPEANRWTEIGTDYIDLRVYYDILKPSVSLIVPINNYNSSTQNLEFNCSVVDDQTVSNISLYGNWSGWHLNETNYSGINNIDYSFSKTIGEGWFIWNCYACDNAGNCDFASFNRTFSVDITAPEVNLIYPGNNYNFSSFLIPRFNFSVSDANDVVNCSLYGNWSGWHRNQTIDNLVKDVDINFSQVEVPGDEYYVWNVECYDFVGNSGFNNTNYTFAAFLYPDAPNSSDFNISQTANDGTGNITLFWGPGNHSFLYRVYNSTSMTGFFSLLNETSYLNFTDETFRNTGDKRRFYRIDSWNPTGQNSSSQYFGTHIYALRHNVNTRNWIGFPSNFNYLKNASDALNEIPNATAVSMWNQTDQRRVTCNTYSCPSTYECTPTNCNFSFNMASGRGYEVNINSTAPSAINWSGVGIVLNPVMINLIKYNSTYWGKNWVSICANTTLVGADQLLNNITYADAVTDWDENAQTSLGLIHSPFPWAQYLGTNFSILLEGGYEVSVNQTMPWQQI